MRRAGIEPAGRKEGRKCAFFLGTSSMAIGRGSQWRAHHHKTVAQQRHAFTASAAAIEIPRYKHGRILTMLPLGKDSFWAMSNLAMAGDLASCESCVEHFYFQSQRNARAFLEACAEGGLVEKISLLDLLGDFEPRSPLAPRQIWYDQAIYISAPEFRRANATNA